MIKLIAVASLLAACTSSPGQPEPGTDDPPPSAPAAAVPEARSWAAFCAVSQRHDLRAVDPADHDRVAWDHAARAVTHPAIRVTIGEAAGAAGAEQVERLAKAAAAAGVTRCHFVDYLRRRDVARRCRDQGDATACVAVAASMNAGVLFDDDADHAGAFVRLACQHGHRPSCAAAGEPGPASKP